MTKANEKPHFMGSYLTSIRYNFLDVILTGLSYLFNPGSSVEQGYIFFYKCIFENLSEKRHNMVAQLLPSATFTTLNPLFFYITVYLRQTFTQSY